MKKKYDFSNVKIKDDLAKQIDDFVKSDLAKKYGINSRADFVSKAVLKTLEEYQPRFQHLNMMDDNVKIVDFQKNRVATIYFRNGGQVRCDLCNRDNCEHIKYALDQEDVQKALKERGWKNNY